jgi:hypothetical protein
MALTAVGKLNYRLMDALGGFDVTPEERSRVIEAWNAAGGEMSATWEKLPLGIQHLVVDIEGRDPQSWADPADLPSQQGI